jgi:hypothetical protein
MRTCCRKRQIKGRFSKPQSDEKHARPLCEVLRLLTTAIRVDDTYKAPAAEGRNCRTFPQTGTQEAQLGGYQERGVQVQR